MHTNQYIAELRPKIAKLLAPGASLMVMQKKLRGIRQVGESEIEVEISGAPRRALRSDQTA